MNGKIMDVLAFEKLRFLFFYFYFVTFKAALLYNNESKSAASISVLRTTWSSLAS